MNNYKTGMYDIHLSFEPQYDDTPRLYAHCLYRDAQGEWNIESNSQPDDSYYLTEQEATQLARNLGYEDYFDLRLEEWFSNIAIHNIKYLPESVRFWIRNLPEYKPETYSPDSQLTKEHA